jgi:hypothetical protein
MHHYRLVLLGSGSSLALAERALEEHGAHPIGPREPSTWVWSVEDGVSAHELEMCARSLVTTCVQALALFGSAHPTFKESLHQ